MLDLSTPPIYSLYSFTDSDCWISILLLKVSSDITHLSRGSFQVKLHISKTRLLSNQDVTTSKLCMSRFYFELPYPNFFRSFSEGKGHCLERCSFKVVREYIPLLAKYFTRSGEASHPTGGVLFFLFHHQLHNCTCIQIYQLMPRVYTPIFLYF